MIFPIGDEQVHGGHKPIIAYLMIAINCIVFAIELFMPPWQQEAFVQRYGMIPIEIIHGTDLYTLLTNMFLHGGWMHLIGNMLFLWVFGDNIEAIIGKWKFLLFYVAGGVFASLAHMVFNLGSHIPAIGASGAIAAVLGAYLIMFPASKVKIFVLYIFRSFHIPAIYFLVFWALQQFVNGFLTILPSSAATGVAWWAHIGGFVFGVAFGWVIRRMAETPKHQYVSPRDFV